MIEPLEPLCTFFESREKEARRNKNGDSIRFCGERPHQVIDSRVMRRLTTGFFHIVRVEIT